MRTGDFDDHDEDYDYVLRTSYLPEGYDSGPIELADTGFDDSSLSEDQETEERLMTDEIHPIKLEGNWEVGYALDVHTVSSQFLGYDECGTGMFDTERSQVGELLYRLKYRSDKSVIPDIVRLVTDFASFKTVDVIVPVPPTHTNRPFQPVLELAKAIGAKLNLPVLTDVVIKIKDTPELKNVEEPEEREEILRGAFRVRPVGRLSGKTVLLFDDLYRSGATLSSLTSVLYDQGKAKCVKVLTLTKTRSKS